MKNTNNALLTALYGSTGLNKIASIANTGPVLGWPQHTFVNGNGAVTKQTYDQGLWVMIEIAGSWEFFPAETWTSGFFASTLYALNLRESILCPSDNGTSSIDWLSLAQKWNTPEFESTAQAITNTHDVGFLSYPAQYGGSWDAVLEMAQHLADRFSPTVGCTRSWEDGGPDDFVVVRVATSSL